MWKRTRKSQDWLAGVLGPGAPELSCDACFDALDRYVELELAGDRDDGRLAEMEAHLRGCPACREEHDLLLAYAGGRRG